MPAVVLVTGVSRYLGGRLAAQLAADPAVDRVIGIDTVPPHADDAAMLGRTEFVRADIRNPLISRVVAQAAVTTIVHASLTHTPRAAGGRSAMQEMNVIGTMQLLAACQKSDSVRRVVLASTTAVYGSSPATPAILAETAPTFEGGGGFTKDAVEVEGYLRGFARRRPDVDVTVLRLADIVGPTADTALSRYLCSPVVTTSLGFDPRLQVLHEADAIETLRLAATSSRPGVFNVAGAGVLGLSQILRRLGRIRLPVPTPAAGLVAGATRNSARADVSAEQARYLEFGRVVDTTLLRTDFGYHPRYTTAQAIDALRPRVQPTARLGPAALGVLSRVVQARVRQPAISGR